MKYCEQCKEVREEKYQFCNKCGTPLIEKPEEKAPQETPQGERKCPNCGKILKADNRFCTGCGQPVDQIPGSAETNAAPVTPPPVAPPPQMQPVTPTPQERVSQPVPQMQPMQQRPVQSSREKSSSKQKDKRPGIMALIIAAAVIGAILLFIGSFLLTEYLVYDVTPMELYQRYIQGEAKDAGEEDEEEDRKKYLNAEQDEDVTEEDLSEDAELSKDEPEPAAVETPAPTPEPTSEPTPEPTPTPYVWPDWDLDFNAEQASVDDAVKNYRKTKGHYKKHDYGDTYYYTQDGYPVIIGAKKDYNGWKYNREYIGSSIYYVEMDNDYQTTQKFYFAEGKLFRVIDEDGYVHDYASPGWEEYDEIGRSLIEERTELKEEYEWRQK